MLMKSLLYSFRNRSIDLSINALRVVFFFYKGRGRLYALIILHGRVFCLQSTFYYSSFCDKDLSVYENKRIITIIRGVNVSITVTRKHFTFWRNDSSYRKLSNVALGCDYSKDPLLVENIQLVIYVDSMWII